MFRGRGDSARLRLLPYFVVLALPIVIGVWAFANFAARNARHEIDTRLQTSLTVAIGEYGNVLNQAQARVEALAGSRSIQRDLARRDRGKLLRVAKKTPNAAVFMRGILVAGHAQTIFPSRSVDIIIGRRKLGRVSIGVPLDRTLLARLARDARLASGERLVAVRGRAVVGDSAGQRGRVRLPQGLGVVRFGNSTYRAVSLRPVRGRSDLRLGVLKPQESVSSAEWRARRRILLAGLAILGGIGFAAYGTAPAIARTRLSRQQRAQAAQVLEHVRDGVFLLDRKGKIRFWNPGAEAITGLAAKSVEGKSPELIFRGWSSASPDDAALGTDRPPRHPSEETTAYEIDGRKLWLSLSGVEFPEGTVYAFRDQTERYRLEEARGDFVATVSHELRTPLASVHGAAATLRERGAALPDATRRNLLDVIFEQSDRLAHLVEQILIANQLSFGNVQLVEKQFDAAELARRAVDSLRTIVPKRVALELSAPEQLPAVFADPERTYQVVVNLIDNAVKYSPGGGLVDIRLAQRDGYVRLSVRDQGLGIPAQEQERIFEKFYRLDASMSRGIGGSGLGLYICRELVTLMNGRFDVRSRPGVGSIFSFDLPLAGSQTPSQTPA